MNREMWIKKALEEGFESFEVYQDVQEEKKYSWYKGKLDTFVTSHVTGTALRGIYKGKLANYATEDNGDAQIERVLSLMKEQAEAVTSEDEVFIRELTSKVQTMRKEADFVVTDHIRVFVDGSTKLEVILAADSRDFMNSVLCDELNFGKSDDGYSKEWDINGENVTICVKKL